MVLLLLLLLAFPELYFYNSYYIYLGRQEIHLFFLLLLFMFLFFWKYFYSTNIYM